MYHTWMPAKFSIARLSLRTLLGAAALAALITALTLGSLLLITAGSARSVTKSAQEAHNRVQAFSALISAVRNYHVTSYAVVQVPSPQSTKDFETARARFFETLDVVLKLPRNTPHQRELAELLELQSRSLDQQFLHAMDTVRRIDMIWRTQGSEAAGAEADLAGRPVREFQLKLEQEISRGDEQVDAATGLALSLSRAVIIACIFCLFLAVTSWAIVHGLLLRRLGPGLRRLEEGTRAFATGDLRHRVDLGGQDELAKLSAAFDTMAEQILEKQRTLQQARVDLERAVKERTEQLEEANSELSASDGRRRAFLADIGHELRTPLTIIRGEAQVALRTADQPDFRPHEVFERIIEHTLDLSRMVEDLFLIARAEAGGLPMNPKRVDLRELIARVAGDFAALVADGGATINAMPGPALFWVIDPDRLRRALAALVDNALRHTHGGVNVVIDTRRTDGGVEIIVADDGPGIDPTIVPELFQRFRRGHTQGEGSGLGLSLVRALVEAQGGHARLENRAEGGARAILEFRHTKHKTERGLHEHEPATG